MFVCQSYFSSCSVETFLSPEALASRIAFFCSQYIEKWKTFVISCYALSFRLHSIIKKNINWFTYGQW